MILDPVRVTASGRPVLHPGEVERSLLDKAELHFPSKGGVKGQESNEYSGGYLILTNHRLMWMDGSAAPSAGRSCCLHVHAIASLTKKSPGLLSSKTKIEATVKLSSAGAATIGHHVSTSVLTIKVKAAADPFLVLLEELLRGPPPAAVHAPTHPPPAGSAAAAPPPLPWQAHYAAGGGAALPPPSQLQQPYGAPPPALPSFSQQQQQQQQSAGVQPDARLIQQIMDMGFSRQQATQAVTATNSEGPQQALDWVLAFGNQMPPPPPSQQQPLPYGYPPQPQSQPQSQPYGGAAGYGSYPPRVQQQQHGPAYPVAPTAAGGGGGGHYPSVPGAGGSYAPGYGLPYGVPSQPQLQPTAATRPASGAAAPSSVGVAGIVRREEAKVTATGQSLSAAFSDLSALMQMAADMVKLAERFRGVATGQQAAAAAAGGAAPGDDLLMDAETQLELISMGIASPVTKESAGARYHVELSRQLADFLAAPLAKAGGVMTVADVYCLFNRARGTELVSPDDLLQAISMFQSVGVPLRLRRFASGVTVVQSSLHSDAEMVRRISQLVAGGSAAPGGGAAADSCGPGITAADLSRAAGISLTIAREHLLSAEAGCVLCRDDGPEGLRFYRNFFTDSAVLSYLRQRQQQQQLRSV